MSRFWAAWGGLAMWFVGGLISVSMTAFLAWHDLDKRVALLQQSVARIEEHLGTARPTRDLITTAATSGTREP